MDKKSCLRASQQRGTHKICRFACHSLLAGKTFIAIQLQGTLTNALWSLFRAVAFNRIVQRLHVHRDHLIDAGLRTFDQLLHGLPIGRRHDGGVFRRRFRRSRHRSCVVLFGEQKSIGVTNRRPNLNPTDSERNVPEPEQQRPARPRRRRPAAHRFS